MAALYLPARVATSHAVDELGLKEGASATAVIASGSRRVVNGN
jgi:molybdopterin-binding protein